MSGAIERYWRELERDAEYFLRIVSGPEQDLEEVEKVHEAMGYWLKRMRHTMQVAE